MQLVAVGREGTGIAWGQGAGMHFHRDFPLFPDPLGVVVANIEK